MRIRGDVMSVVGLGAEDGRSIRSGMRVNSTPSNLPTTHLIPDKHPQPLRHAARGVVPPQGAEPPVVGDEDALPLPHRRGLPLGAGAALRGEALRDAEAEEAAPPAVVRGGFVVCVKEGV